MNQLKQPKNQVTEELKDKITKVTACIIAVPSVWIAYYTLVISDKIYKLLKK